MGYEVAPAVRALAKLRADRESGEGTFDDMERRAFLTSPGRTFDRICNQYLDAAKQDIADVQAVLKEVNQWQR